MNLSQYAFLADENIHPDVITHLRIHGCDVISIKEIGLIGVDDLTVLRKANNEKRVVITHDSDFGTLTILKGQPIIGIVYLRPGHIDPMFTIGTLNALFEKKIDIDGPFFIVAERTGMGIKIRIRKLEKQSI